MDDGWGIFKPPPPSSYGKIGEEDSGEVVITRRGERSFLLLDLCSSVVLSFVSFDTVETGYSTLPKLTLPRVITPPTENGLFKNEGENQVNGFSSYI